MTQTLTLQDATITDLKTALAGTAPIPTPTPVPVPVPPPVIIPTPVPTPAGSNHVVLQAGQDGENMTASYDPATKSTWLSLWSYAQTNPAKNIYAGSFEQYLVRNSAGTWMGPVCVNGGFIDGTAGKEQGSYDIVFLLDGKPANISFVGRYTPPGSTPQDPGLMCWPPDVLAIGSLYNRYSQLWLTKYPVRPGMPAGAIGCVKVSGGYVPIFP